MGEGAQQSVNPVVLCTAAAVSCLIWVAYSPCPNLCLFYNKSGNLGGYAQAAHFVNLTQERNDVGPEMKNPTEPNVNMQVKGKC